MHDFFYQPMLYDLLDINNNIAEYDDEDKNGKAVSKKSVLTENDDLFDKYRYKHIAEALDGIPADFQVFMNNNANAKLSYYFSWNIKTAPVLSVGKAPIFL